MTDDIETFDFEDGDGEAGECPYCGGGLTYGTCEKDATGLGTKREPGTMCLKKP